MSTGLAPDPSAAHVAVQRELLVRYLDTWAPAALHGARRSTYAETYAGSAPDDAPVVAALRVFAEFPELLARHQLTVLAAAPDDERAGALGERLAAVHAELGAPGGLSLRVLTGDLLPHLGSALAGPLFVHLDAQRTPPPGDRGLATLAGGKASEVLVAGAIGGGRDALRRAGFGFVAEVELVDGTGTGQPLLFGTGSAKHLAAFKEAMWAVDEYAGVRYRDPRDTEHALLDISLSPPVGPLRRALANRLRQGPCTVAELREHTVTETIYQAADASRVLTGLLSSGAAARSPERGRLTAETVIRAGRTAA